MAARRTTTTERREVTTRDGDGGDGLFIPLLIGGAALYFGARLIKKDVVVPLQTKQYVERIQITAPAFAISIKHKQATISFTINNPNTTPMQIQAIIGRVGISQADPKKGAPVVLGNVDRFGNIIIPPVQSTRVTLTVQIKALNTIAYLAEMMEGKWIGQVVHFQGTVTANGRPWPINETIRLA